MIPDAKEGRLRPKVRKVLEARCRAPSTPQGEVKRARIVLLAAEGRSTRSIAKAVGVQPRIVSKWRHRFAGHGLAGQNDRPRATKKPIYGQATNKRNSGASCASTTSIWLPVSSGAKAMTPSSRRKAADVVSLYIDPLPRRLFSVIAVTTLPRPLWRVFLDHLINRRG
jgi:Homeodomain-like domain